MNLGLKGKRVLITAASKGIGRAAAEEFTREGCKVAICSRSKENLDKTADEIKNTLDETPFWTVCDLNKPDEVNNAWDVIYKKLGGIDILVNNCGGPAPGYFEEISEEEWQEGFEQVLMSAVRFTRLVLPGMKEKKWGRIINVTSLSVKQPADNLLLSNVFRSGVTSFAKTLSNSVGKYNITVNNVAPGYTLTSRLYELALEQSRESGESHEHVLAQMANDIPSKRLARPDEIASSIVFLASVQAAYINGVTVPVDGGFVKATY